MSKTEKFGCLSTVRMVTSIDDIQSLRFWKAIAAEFLGTFLLVFVGCGSTMSINDSAPPQTPQIAFCFGLSIATIVWSINHISGGHINPAITIALFATRKISLARAVFYVIFQLVGSIVGAALLLGVTPDSRVGTLGMTRLAPGMDAGKGLGVEIFITFVLVFTVFASLDSRRKDLNGSTPLSIGLSVTMCHLFAVPYTGSSMNTARSFGPAMIMWKWGDFWIYTVGPILGGLIAGLLYDTLFAMNASLAKARACMLSSDYDDDKYDAQKTRIRILEECGDQETIKLKEAEDGKAGSVEEQPTN